MLTVNRGLEEELVNAVEGMDAEDFMGGMEFFDDFRKNSFELRTGESLEITAKILAELVKGVQGAMNILILRMAQILTQNRDEGGRGIRASTEDN